jgi:hypothetical protein
MRAMRRRSTPPAEATPEARGIGEGPNPVEQTGSDYVSPAARRERAQKQQGNPKDRQAEQERIARDDNRYRQGFPVAGHGEPEPVNRPHMRQRP